MNKKSNILELWQTGVSMYEIIPNAEKIKKLSTRSEENEAILTFLALLYYPESPLFDIADLRERKQEAKKLAKLNENLFHKLQNLDAPNTRSLVFEFLKVTPKAEDIKLLAVYEELLVQNYDIIFSTQNTKDLTKEAVEIQQRKDAIASFIDKYTQRVKELRRTIAGDNTELLDAINEDAELLTVSFIERYAK